MYSTLLETEDSSYAAGRFPYPKICHLCGEFLMNYPMDSAGKRQISPLGTSQVVTTFSVLEINRHALCQ